MLSQIRHDARLCDIIEVLHGRMSLEAGLFREQGLAFRDTSTRKCYLTSRRAGKTTCVLTDFLIKAVANPNTHYAYIALTQPSAEGIAWPILQELNRQHSLGGSLQESKLRLKLPNASSIKLYGADRSRWSSRLLGHKYGGVSIDEAAFFSVDLRELIDEVIDPTLNDLGGTLILTSTPGIIPAGMFYEITEKKLPGWSVHRWSALDNPHMRRQTLAKIAELKKNNPEIEGTPSFQRNYLGKWVTDFGSRVYRFDLVGGRNSIDSFERSPDDRFLLGLDVGWYDTTAFSVIAWSEKRPDVIEVESYREKEMPLDKIASYLNMYRETYHNLTMVADPSHMQVIEELRRRYSLPLIPAKKDGKPDWIEIANTDYDAGRIKILDSKRSKHVEEMADLVWQQKPGGDFVEAPGLENGCCDAFLYAYRYCYHYRYKRPEPTPSIGTQAHFEAEERRIIEALEHESEARSNYFGI